MQTHMPKSEIELEAAAVELKYFKHMSQPIVDKLRLKIQSKINLIICCPRRSTGMKYVAPITER